ncbi:hypothetical protein [Streptomyces sp. AGS-58]|uniref:hypothetical protein n=1 Tax=unclassified Streptomyces TaxID=2593676 RepID=UPI0035A2D8D3
MSTKKTAEKNRRNSWAGTTRDLLSFSGNECVSAGCRERLTAGGEAWIGEFATSGVPRTALRTITVEQFERGVHGGLYVLKDPVGDAQ